MIKRLEEIRKYFSSSQIDALLVTSKSNRRYLSGFTGSTGHILIGEKQAKFITDFRYMDQANEQCTGFDIINNERKPYEALKNQIIEMGIKRLGFEKNFVSFADYQLLQSILSHCELVPVSGIIEDLRMIKDEEEIAIIRQAVAIADSAFTHILGYIRPGVRESDISLELEYFMRKQGATSSSFDIIVASGVRSALPHGVASHKVIEQGEFVTLDFGAMYNGYISDLTRTVAVGEVSDELIKIYDIVLQAQIAGVKNIKAGLNGKEADALCRDIIASHGYGTAFGHSTGHAIGMDVHEGPSLSTASDILLQPGMVVTVEPGIYISGLGGVRIEDDILITEDGNELLTKSTKELITLS